MPRLAASEGSVWNLLFGGDALSAPAVATAAAAGALAIGAAAGFAAGRFVAHREVVGAARGGGGEASSWGGFASLRSLASASASSSSPGTPGTPGTTGGALSPLATGGPAGLLRALRRRARRDQQHRRSRRRHHHRSRRAQPAQQLRKAAGADLGADEEDGGIVDVADATPTSSAASASASPSPPAPGAAGGGGGGGGSGSAETAAEAAAAWVAADGAGSHLRHQARRRPRSASQNDDDDEDASSSAYSSSYGDGYDSESDSFSHEDDDDDGEASGADDDDDDDVAVFAVRRPVRLATPAWAERIASGKALAARPVLRNLLITQSYHDISRELGRLLNARRDPPAGFAASSSATAATAGGARAAAPSSDDGTDDELDSSDADSVRGASDSDSHMSSSASSSWEEEEEDGDEADEATTAGASNKAEADTVIHAVQEKAAASAATAADPALVDFTVVAAASDARRRHRRRRRARRAPGGAHDPLPYHANWCTIAKWASKNVGVFIRQEQMPALFRGVLAQDAGFTDAARHVEEFIEEAAARRHRAGAAAVPHDTSLLGVATYVVQEISQYMVEGNLKVYAELGPVFSRLIACYGGADGAELDRERYSALRASLNPEPTTENGGGQQMLIRAMDLFVEAVAETEHKRKSELVLLFNVFTGFHEQIRLQPCIAGSLAVPVAAAIGRYWDAQSGGVGDSSRSWFSALKSSVTSAMEPAVRESFKQMATHAMMTLPVPITLHHEEALRVMFLGRTLPPQPLLLRGAARREAAGADAAGTGAATAAAAATVEDVPLYPEELREFDHPEFASELLRGVGSGEQRADVGAKTWDNLTQRMTFIFGLFRSRQYARALYREPFCPEHRIAIARDFRIPREGSQL